MPFQPLSYLPRITDLSFKLKDNNVTAPTSANIMTESQISQSMDSAQLLEVIVKNLCSLPEQVKVERKVDDLGVLLTLHVAPEDMGLIIGKLGSTAQAIRTIVRNKGLAEKARVNVKIFDPNPSRVRSFRGSAASMDIVFKNETGL